MTAFYTTVAFLAAGPRSGRGRSRPLGAGDTGASWGLIAAAGLIAGTAHFLIVFAYRKGAASLVAPFEYSSLIVALALGFLVFGDIPTLAAAAGMGLLVLAGVLLVRQRKGPHGDPGRREGAEDNRIGA